MQVPSLTGDAATIQWSYYTAAAVTRYTVTPVYSSGRRVIASWRVRGTLTPGTVNRFKVSQRPLLFVASMNNRVVRWPIVELDIQGGQMTGILGPLETETRHGEIVVCRDLFDLKPAR